MTRVYLSGPMTGIDENNFPAFHNWAERLRAQGYEVVSPAEIQEAGTWELCLRADLRELLTCDAIALMPGWESSKGANLELHVAHRIGMQVIHLPLQFDLVSHLHRQIAFSTRTFGPGDRTEGVVDHITKNEGRQWPDWRTAEPGKAIEHVRTNEGVAA